MLPTVSEHNTVRCNLLLMLLQFHQGPDVVRRQLRRLRGGDRQKRRPVVGGGVAVALVAAVLLRLRDSLAEAQAHRQQAKPSACFVCFFCLFWHTTRATGSFESSSSFFTR